jgi:hypothetical protein
MKKSSGLLRFARKDGICSSKDVFLFLVKKSLKKLKNHFQNSDKNHQFS